MIYLNEAYKQALKAYKKDEVPVGAIIVKDNKVISRAYNKKEKDNNVFGHAELIAIKKASKKLNSWRLNGCEMYVTLEPCSMCLSALIHSRIDKVYYGAIDYKAGAIEGAFNLQECGFFNHYVETKYLEDSKCQEVLKSYFKNKRVKK